MLRKSLVNEWKLRFLGLGLGQLDHSVGLGERGGTLNRCVQNHLKCFWPVPHWQPTHWVVLRALLAQQLVLVKVWMWLGWAGERGPSVDP